METVWETLASSLLMFGRIYRGISRLFFLVGFFNLSFKLFTHYCSVHNSISSWLTLGKFCVGRNLSISWRLYNLFAYNSYLYYNMWCFCDVSCNVFYFTYNCIWMLFFLIILAKDLSILSIYSANCFIFFYFLSSIHIIYFYSNL